MKTFLAFAIALYVASSSSAADTKNLVFQAEDAALSSARAEVVDQSTFKSGKGVSLKPDVTANVDSPDVEPDLTLKIKAPEAGRYVFVSNAAVDDAGRAQMKKAKTKQESLFIKIAVGPAQPARYVVYVPWATSDNNAQTLGKFDLTGQEQEVRVWLPHGVRLDYLQISPYTPPKVPKEAADYKPSVLPTKTRPRLWVNADSLPKVKANLVKGENARIWKKVQQEAKQQVNFKLKQEAGGQYNPDIEAAVVNKAFVYLMTGDREAGREAIDLTRRYLEAVEFNNLLDITREIGRTMYAAARVYDWCYDLMSPEERESMRRNMMRLADDMEIGWPPFKQGVVNGHGAEAQLHCHLLSMAISIYYEDPLPYQYCAYRILEELVPMRNFEYQSPRHNQGIGYGIYRFGWDLHAAWLMYRMSGQKVFDSNIEDLHKYWLYMRLPNGFSFPDGDGNADGRAVNLGQTALLAGAYAEDPIMKKDFHRQGGLPHDPLMVLLLNDPDLKPAEDFTSLPLTLDFGPILGGMVARTGWNFSDDSDDVVVAMTGGGYYFGNHQHVDAGSFQIYYRGIQAADLGQYVFYGTPYDMNFNKRSIAHSMMLAYDPNESFGANRLNDGGARFAHTSPGSPEAVKKDPRFQNGKVLSADFGPSKQKPEYSYFSVDLTSAYSDKIRNYTRTFCFLNLDNKETPAALIVLDNMETSSPGIKKSWQVNTLNPPKTTANGVQLTSSEGRQTGYVNLQMLRPAAESRDLKVYSGKDASTVEGQYLEPPKLDGPQANGHRIQFSPKQAQEKDTFLTVMTMSPSEQTALTVDLKETSEVYALSLADRLVIMSRTGTLLEKAFTVEVAGEGKTKLLLTGLKPGVWTIKGKNGQAQQDVEVTEGDNTAYVVVSKGQLMVEPKL